MVDENGTWARQGEAFWRAHHEAWKRSDLNQRQYCQAEGIPRTGTGANSAMLGQLNQRAATAGTMIGVQMLTMAIASRRR